jgi:type III pantothenate kinase
VILLLDAGNTRLKWGLWSAGRWQARGWLPSGEAGRLGEVLAGAAPERTLVSCVAGEAVRAALARVLAGLGGPVSWLQAEAERHGLCNLYAAPGELGADRYAMLVACLHLGLAPCVVVGAGTALTADALDAGGRFLGGLIMPGAALMRQALRAGTAGVAPDEGRVQDFPRCTADAVQTGIARALAGGVEAMRVRLAAVAGSPVRVVVSGGDAERLAGLLAAPVSVVEDLVLEGLLWIARGSDVPGRSR